MWSKSLFLAILLSLPGCVSTATPEQLASADYGTITPTYKEAIQNYMVGVLIDPESGRYRYFGEPIKGYAFVRGTINPPEFGYLVNVGINAKNRMGGYSGEKLYAFLFKNSQFWMLSDYTAREIIK
jgi:hypothetical protein